MKLINADELLKSEIERCKCVPVVCTMDSMGYAWEDISLKEVIDSQPEIEAEPVRHGHWIETTEWIGSFGKARRKCSECGTIFDGVPFTRGDGKGSKFCEECGAKMDKQLKNH